MPKILAVGTQDSPYLINQELAYAKAREHFQNGFQDVERLLKVFQNSEIEARYFSAPIEWFLTDHTLADRNNLYIRMATELGIGAIHACLQNEEQLQDEMPCGEIEAIFFVSTTGLSTPSIEARIMNKLPFRPNTKRIPIWGLGCAGGVAGLARAREYCLAFPAAKVLVINLELCSLTFQRKDLSKSNLVGASIFADGTACTLVVGDEVKTESWTTRDALPRMIDHQTTLMPDSEAVMGWDVKDEGLYVVFSRDIPNIIRGWMRENVDSFLAKHRLARKDITQFVAHPGGRKVLEAYEETLEMSEAMTAIPRDVLRRHGNMSSPSVIYVLQEVLRQQPAAGDVGLMAALGPGFSSELMLLRWE